MLEVTKESENWPGTSYTFRPLTGPKMLNLTSQRANWGDACYDAFLSCCTAWVDAPMLGGDTSARFDPAVTYQLMPSFVEEVVISAMEHWTLKEEDRKNS